MKYKINIHLLQLSIGALVFCFISMFVLSLQSNVVYGISIGEEYAQQNVFVDGVLVSIKSDDTESIEASNLNNDKYVIGVTQDIESNLVTITKDYNSKPVAISGEVSVLASDINGSIKKGDLLTASYIDGVVMKVQEGSGARIIGIALEDFNSSGSRTYTDLDIPTGTVAKTNVNYVEIRLSGGEVFATQVAAGASGVSSGFVDKLAGKDVPIYRLATGLFVFIASVVVAGLFIFSSIKGSFISFGRNPLASNSIYLGLIQISTISVAFLSVGAALAYLVWTF